jgi:hypothetical protein
MRRKGIVMNESILLMAIMMRGKCLLGELFLYLEESLRDDNPWKEINDLQHDLVPLKQEELIKGGLFVSSPEGMEITEEGIAFLQSDFILLFLKKSFPTLWKE